MDTRVAYKKKSIILATVDIINELGILAMSKDRLPDARESRRVQYFNTF
jgi:hypothetical protein